MLAHIIALLTNLVVPALSSEAQYWRPPQDFSYKLTISQTTQYPDGVKKSDTLTFNKGFPGPLLIAEVGSRLLISVTNNYSRPTSVHWHGLYQKGTQFQDGPSMITQCPLLPGQTQTYNFTTGSQSGTYWYHAHYHSQYTDGLIGPLIIYDCKEPSYYGYDAELVLILSDWYHGNYTENEAFFFATGFPPFPNSPLINGNGVFPCFVFPQGFGTLIKTLHCYPNKQYRNVFHIQPGKTYRIRVINASALSTFTFSIDGHKLSAIEVDGVALERPSEEADYTYIGAGQRYSFLLKMDKQINRYLIRSIMKDDFVNLFPDAIPNINRHVEDTLLPKATAVLMYDSEMSNPEPVNTVEPFSFLQYISISPDNRKSFELLDDNELNLISKEGKTAPEKVDVEFLLHVELTPSLEHMPRSLFNRSRYISNETQDPLLIQVIKGKRLSSKTNPLYVSKMQNVQIIINNFEPWAHPIHLHGHTFWVVAKGEGIYNKAFSKVTLTTVRRDTVMIEKNSYIVIRFVADNPGVWSLHCHIDWHNSGGMTMTIVEGKEVLVGMEIPEETRRICSQWGHNSKFAQHERI